MFGIQFYPTPLEVIQQMLYIVDTKDKHVLEPSAGKGDILDNIHNAKSLSCCEIDENLRSILKDKNYNILEQNFLNLKSEDISHINCIIANPPFLNGDEHVLHMFDIANDNTEIVCLVNYETINNPFSKSRKELSKLISLYGYVQNLGKCFSDSEHETDVEVGMIYLKKPSVNEEFEYDGFFTEETEEMQYDGIMKYDYIRDLVNRYVEACKLFDKQLTIISDMNNLISSSQYFDTTLSVSLNSGDKLYTKTSFKKDLQKNAWKSIFNKLDMDKYVTKQLRQDINKFIENQTNIPFTMRNIYRMLEIIIGTQKSRMNNAILELVGKLTKHTSENRWNVEGWVSNSSYMINQQFILPMMVEVGYSGEVSTSYGYNNIELVDDFYKALCYFKGIDYNYYSSFHNRIGNGYIIVDENNNDKIVDIISSRDLAKKGAMWKPNGKLINRGDVEFGKWCDWGFFEIKAYKKGTVHFRFKDESLWITVNNIIAEKYGYVLPEKIRKNKKK